jgi:hypothetical protein
MGMLEEAAAARAQMAAEKERIRQVRLERRRLSQADYMRQWKWRRAGHEGATVEQYEAMKAAQGGKCAICGQEPKKKALAYHPKGLICTACSVHLAWTKRNLVPLGRFLDLPTAVWGD